MTPKGIYTGEYIAFSPFDRQALRTLIRSIEKPFKRVAEIGSWMGNGSTRVFIEELSGGRGVLYCVDHWHNRNADTIPAGGEFPAIHAGVVLAVDEKFSGTARLWSQSVVTLPEGSSGRSSIWDKSV